MHLFRRNKDSNDGSGKGGSSSSPVKSFLSASLPASSRDGKAPPPLPVKANVNAGGTASGAPRGRQGTNGGAEEFGQLQRGGGHDAAQLQPHQSTAPPAFMVNRSGASYLKPLPDTGLGGAGSGSRANASTKSLQQTRRASTGSVPSIDGLMRDTDPGAEMQLCYGYWPIETQRELNLVQVEEVVRLCGAEIRSRGIEEPLLFSTKALDINSEHICNLIRTYLDIRERETWRRDLRFANPHDLAGLIKWALGRYVNPQGGRGCIPWEMFERWRFGEREREFPVRYITTYMLYLLPTQAAALLTTLFNLMSSAVAYTTKNGCTTRKLSTLFAPYIFGLPDDGTFEHCYTAFNRFSHATEHLLLAYIRDQIAQESTPVPVRLRELVQDYPHGLPTNLNKPPTGAQLQQVVRIRRHIRFYSKNLVQTAGGWDVPRSKAWAMISPSQTFDSAGMDTAAKASPFSYTWSYRHLLNIRSDSAEGDDDEGEGMQKFGSVVEKEWSSFMHTGFAAPDANKLRFDLTESERQNRRKRHETIDWTAFENSGFAGRETFLDNDLSFNPGANDLVTYGATGLPRPGQLRTTALASSTNANGLDVLNEEHRKFLANKARNIEKSLPPFNYDITPREERPIQVDKQFLEVFADVLCSSGWARDEMKESNWALVQYRTRPLDAGTRSPSSGSAADGRTDETWFLIEEIIPAEYRAALLEAGLQQQKPKSSRRISFLRSVRKKTSKAPPMPTIASPVGSADILAGSKGSKISLPYIPSRNGSGAVVVHGSRSTSPALKQPDDSVFTPGSGGPPTKVVSLTKSFSSAGMSHSSTAHTIPEEQNPEPIDTSPVSVNREDISNGIGGTLSSQHAAGTSNPAGVDHSSQMGGIGYTKPAIKSGNTFMDMVRKTTRRKDSSTLNPTAFGTPQATNRSAVRTPIESPTELHTPASAASAGFNLQEHGVAGSGQPMSSPTAWVEKMDQQGSPALRAQRYVRAPPSSSGLTSRTMDTQVTSSHSDIVDRALERERDRTTSSPSPSPARERGTFPSRHTMQAGEFSPAAARPSQETVSTATSAYDRELPPPLRFASDEANAANRLTSASAMDAQEIVDAYDRSESSYLSQRGKRRVSAAPSENPYDGLDDASTSDEHQEIIVPAHVADRHIGADAEQDSPNGEPIWRGSVYEGPPPRTSSRSGSDTHTDVIRSDSGVHLSSPQQTLQPRMHVKGHPSQEVVPTLLVTSPTTAPSPPSKPSPTRSQALTQEIENRKQAITSPTVPINGSGRVSQLAGRFGK